MADRTDAERTRPPRTQSADTTNAGASAAEGRGAPPVVVGISGSSGALLGRRAVEVLGELGRPVHLTYTPACRQVWPEEVGHPLDDDLAQWRARYEVRVCEPDDFRAPMSSGSFPTSGMIVIPCSMRTVSAIAYGTSSNLLERAADVTIKEGRRLVVVPREAPLSAIHLENLLRLARWGSGYIAGGAAPDRARALYEAAERAWREAGRPGSPRFVAATYFGLGPNAAEGVGAYLRGYYGPERGEQIAAGAPKTAQALKERIQAFADSGVDELMCWPCIPDLAQIDLLAEAIG